MSPDGYYEDVRDLGAVRARLLDPLGPGGNRSFVTETFDVASDRRIERASQQADDDAILLVEGSFIQRPELRPHWDFVIFLDVPTEEAHRRGMARDQVAMGGVDRASELYRKRYEPAFTRYVLECDPIGQADAVIDNMIIGSASLVRPR